jgi:serine/threonine-protein kinase
MGMTKTTAVMGSPFYMSPEQMQSARNVDARTDIWAIGVILYELVTGKIPFNGDSLPELCVTIMSKPPAPMTKYRPDVPPGLEPAILKCLEKDRNDRYPNVAELAIALAEFGPKRSRASVVKISRVLRNAGISAVSPSLFPSTPPSGPPSGPASEMLPGAATAASWGKTGPDSTGKRTKAWLWGMGAVAVVAIGAFVGTLVRRGPAPPPVGAATGLVASVAPVELMPPAPVVAAPAPVALPDAPVVATAAAAVAVAAPPATKAAVAARAKAASAKPATASAARTEVKPTAKPASRAAKSDNLGGRL